MKLTLSIAFATQAAQPMMIAPVAALPSTQPAVATTISTPVK